MIYLDRHWIPLPVERTGRRLGQVHSALDRLMAYLPAESLEACSARTGMPVERLIKLNSNENPYGAVPAVMEALGSYRAYHHYPDTQATALLDQLSDYTGLERSSIVLGHGSIDLIHRIWCIYLYELLSETRRPARLRARDGGSARAHRTTGTGADSNQRDGYQRAVKGRSSCLSEKSQGQKGPWVDRQSGTAGCLA